MSNDPVISGSTEVSTRYGSVRLNWREEELYSVCLGPFAEDPRRPIRIGEQAPPAKRARDLVAQILSYFHGEPVDFECSLPERSGTGFQRKIWTALKDIPYGKVESYGGLAQRIGLPPGNARALGSACGRNPLPILFPCHRVVASTGNLTGYYAGTAWKEALLELEGISVEHGRVRI